MDNSDKIKQLFQGLDKDRNGRLTKEEMRGYFKRFSDEEYEKVWHVVDAGGNGYVDYDVFTKWVTGSKGTGKSMTPADMRRHTREFLERQILTVGQMKSSGFLSRVFLHWTQAVFAAAALRAAAEVRRNTANFLDKQVATVGVVRRDASLSKVLQHWKQAMIAGQTLRATAEVRRNTASFLEKQVATIGNWMEGGSLLKVFLYWRVALSKKE